MILPTKHIPARQSLLGVGAVLLRHLKQPRTVTALWERVRGDSNVRTFSRYVLALDLLHAMGAVDLVDGVLRRRKP